MSFTRDFEEGISAYVRDRLANCVVEGINNRTRVIARRACGFHSPEPLIASISLSSSGIELDPPLPTRAAAPPKKKSPGGAQNAPRPPPARRAGATMRDPSMQDRAGGVGVAVAGRSRRAMPRWTVDRAVSFCMQWSSRNEDVAFVTGWIVDIGAGGVQLHGPVPVRPGWRVSVLFLPRDRGPELVSGRVAWARHTKAGCSFGLSAVVDAAFLETIRSDSSRPAARVA